MTTAVGSPCHSPSSTEQMTPPRRSPEVEGTEFEEGEEAMKDWVSVRRKGQVETEKEEMQTK